MSESDSLPTHPCRLDHEDQLAALLKEISDILGKKQEEGDLEEGAEEGPAPEIYSMALVRWNFKDEKVPQHHPP